uniref:RNA-directed DNA polymerase, eukaryota n=1 Tax=Tanacetum cinerariifolium TaxID=118510 RepID=A0A699GMD6_TANCI|nr:hypothetical protein [Tanacetum cinerariifolium]
MDDIENVQTNNVDDHEQVFEVNVQEPVDKDPHESIGLNKLQKDSDPYMLDSLIKKKSGKVTNLNSFETPKFLSRFTPTPIGDQQTFESFHKLTKGDSLKQPGFAMLEQLEETIKVGLAVGLNMEGCDNTLASLETKMLWVDLWMLR